MGRGGTHPATARGRGGGAALLDAFMDGERELTTDDVLRRVRSIRPTSEVKRDEIEELRRWAREHLAIDAVRSQSAAPGERLMEF